MAVSTRTDEAILQLDCEPIKQTIQSLTQQIEEIDHRIGVLKAEAMQLNPLQYIVSQRKVDRIISLKHAFQNEWNNAMNALAICRSAHPAHYHFDRDTSFPADNFPMETR